ncbi:MAG TPA: major capsid protein [Levilactobacillus brevis]|nr:major capsid protein [Levilactobacillus brevis]
MTAMENIAEINTPKNMAAWYEQKILTMPPYIGELYFPSIKVQTDLLSYLMQNQRAPMLTAQSSYDSRPTPINRDKFEQKVMHTKFFRSAMAMNEKDLVELNQAIVNQDDSLVTTAIKKLFDNKVQPLLDMRARREWLDMQALVNGQISINPLEPTLIYESDSRLNLEASTDWTDTENSDPFKDITDAVDTLKKTHGIVPNQILMNTDTLRLFRHNEKLKATLFANNANTKDMWLQESAVVNAMLDELHIVPVVYDQGYEDENGTFYPYVPDGKVVIMNAPIPQSFAKNGGNTSTGVSTGQPVGHMAFAPTPEELQNQLGNIPSKDIQFYDTAVAYHEYFDQGLSQFQTMISMNCLPTLEGGRTIVRMTTSKAASTDSGATDGASK